MATVYLAIQESFQREVALKVMSSSLAEDADFSERFLREARIVSRLVHPNIVTVYDVGIHEGHHYLSMEYIPGTDLKHNFLELDGTRILRLMKEVAAALDYAGKKGYVHRDVKPENIMISQEDGRAVLMDFGIARVADTDNNMTKTGVALGTPYYMSPEQARGKAVDGRSDLYALGVVFYLIVMGKVPYDAESAIAIGIKHISDPVPSLPVALGSLQPLIDKLMAKNPEQRFQAGSEFIVALKNIKPGVIDSWKAIGGMESNVMRHDTPVRTSRKKTERRVPVQTGIRSSGALRIPKEDIADRRRAIEPVEKKRSSALLLVLLLSGILFGAYYFLFGLRFPPSSQDVNSFAKIFGLSPVESSISNDASIKGTSLIANTPPFSQVDKENEDVEAQNLNQENEDNIDPELRDLLNQSRVVAASVALQPELTGQLVSLYQTILDKQGDQSEALEGILKIREKQELRFEEQLKNKNFPQAEASLASLLSWFPELAEDDQYRQLDKRLAVARNVEELLLLAKNYMNEKKLRQPVGGNAVETFNKVLLLSPGNQQAKTGLRKITKTYYGWAKSAQAKGDFDKALSYANSGLQMSKGNNDLQALYKQLAGQRKTKKKISGLLADAERFEQQGILFDKNGSAAQSYLAVLAIQSDNDAASERVQILQKKAVSQAEQLAQNYKFDQAVDQLQQVLEVFPNNEQLGELLLDIEQRKPFVTQLSLSGMPINEADIDATVSSTANINRTLYIAFRYQNFHQPTTVMQVTLYDGARTVQIAAVPVVVSGKKGTANFKIDRPVEAFTEGGYHIDIQMNGKVIKTQSFAVAR